MNELLYMILLWTSVVEATDGDQFYTVLRHPSHSEVETAVFVSSLLTKRELWEREKR